MALILLQLAPRTAYAPQRLKEALLSFNDPQKVVVEFRNAQWLTTEIQQLLTEMRVTVCAADSPLMRLQDWVTSETAYIRLHGRTRWYNSEYSPAELREIGKYIKRLSQKKINTVYVLFNNDYYAYAIKNAVYLDKYLRRYLFQEI